MRRNWVILAAVFSVAFHPSVVSAASDAWSPVSPPLGTIASDSLRRTSDGTLYATALRTLYRSVDDGLTWSVVGRFPTAVRVDLGDAAGSVLFAFGAMGVQRSVDHGATWVQVLDVGAPVVNVLRAPSDSSRVYAVTQPGSVWRSDDGGITWTAPGEQPETTFVFRAAVDPVAPDILYLATSNGFHRTETAGDAWGHVPIGSAFALTVATTGIGDRVFVSAGSPPKVLRSDDRGATWTEMVDLGPNVMRVISARSDDPDTVYAALSGTHPMMDAPSWFVSDDGGDSWTPAPRPDGEWYPAFMGIVHAGSRVVIATDRGLFTSGDGGVSWEVGRGIGDAYVVGFAHGAGDGEMYSASTASGVSVTADGGSSWSARIDGLGSTRITAVAASPATPGHVVAGQAFGQLMVSTDSGVTWSSGAGADVDHVGTISFNPASPMTVYAHDSGSGRMLVSTNGGLDWAAHTAGLPAPEAGNGYNAFRQIAISASGGTLYLAAHDGVYTSEADAASWVRLDSGITGAAGLATHPSDDEVLYVAGVGPDGDGLYRTADGGASWTRLLAGVVGRVAVDPRDASRLLAGSGSGVQGSIDAGASWHPMNRGLDATGGSGPWHPDVSASGPFPATLSLAIDPRHSLRYHVANAVTVQTVATFGILQRYDGAIASDLAITVSPDGGPARPDESTTVSFTVTNTLGDPASDVRVTISASPNIEISELSLDGGTCAPSADDFVCSVPELSRGSTRIGEMTVRSTTAGAGSVILDVASSVRENAPADNTVSFTFSAPPPTPAPPAPPPASGRRGGGNSGWEWLLALMFVAAGRGITSSGGGRFIESYR